MKYLIPFFVFATIMVGCAANNPVTPGTGDSPINVIRNPYSASDDCHKLWAEYNFFIGPQHDKVDVVPRREGRFHLNALKFLEEGGKNLLKITGIKNNGNGTIDLSIQITHPFKGCPQFTGFDVKGIIMFNGSQVLTGPWDDPPVPKEWEWKYGPFRISSRFEGDPQVLNADGYTMRWSPTYESGSDLPILNYWPGKFSKGLPTANVNAYLDFYTQEDRHMFASGGAKTRDYHIYLPPGPLVVAYAVEACWVPPDKMPVMDPLTDFPISANQDEPYFVRLILNNGEPIPENPPPYCCGDAIEGGPCEDLHALIKRWGGIKPSDYQDVYKMFVMADPFGTIPGGVIYGPDECNETVPPDWFMLSTVLFISGSFTVGTHQGLFVLYYKIADPLFYVEEKDRVAYGIYEFTIYKE